MYARTAASPLKDIRCAPLEPMVTLDDMFLSQIVFDVPVGRVVFWEGDTADHLFRVVSGALRLYRLLPNGQRMIAGFAFAGDVLGLAFHARYSLTAEAIKPCSLQRLSFARIQSLSENCKTLSSEMILHLQNELCLARDHMFLTVHQRAEQRIANFLLMLVRKDAKGFESGAHFQVPMTRNDIGDFLGLTTETVSREFTRLRKAGVITTLSREEFVLDKASDLMTIARSHVH